jgi:hypothetical protein
MNAFFFLTTPETMYFPINTHIYPKKTMHGDPAMRRAA